MYPYIIASYPRSGSTWFRFILCHLFYPDIEHDFDSVNKHIPPIDHPPGLLAGIRSPLFYKSHTRETATNIIFLHRHVGDVLESEYWFKKKIYNEERPFPEWLEATNWGAEWRRHVDHYFPAVHNISYLEIGLIETYMPFFSDPVLVEMALKECTLEKMRKLEDRGFGDYPAGDPALKFCRNGTSDQWKQWNPKLQEVLLQKNQIQLKKLGYL